MQNVARAIEPYVPMTFPLKAGGGALAQITEGANMKSVCLAMVAVAALAGYAVPADATPVAPQYSAAAQRGAFLRPLASNAPIDVYISLPGQHANEIDRFIALLGTPGSPGYGRHLTPEAFGRYFGAAPAIYARAVATLRARGFVIDDLPANRTDIVAHAPAAVVSAFFGTPLDLRIDRGRTYFANRFAPVMPAALSGAAVSGLDDYFAHHPMLRRNPRTSINGQFSWAPADLAAAYDLNPLYAAGLDGKGVTIANATSGAATAAALAYFQRRFRLPAAKLVTTPIPATQSLSRVDNGESTLDVDSALGVAREATFDQVVARTTSNHNFDLTYSYIVNNLGKSVHIVTTSWGVCERDFQGTASLTIDEKLFAQALAEGQYWFSASGDNGSDDCEQGGHTPSVDFPGSSPYVISVGGTNVAGKIAGGVVTAWQGETTWQYANSNGASGGGKSILYPKPAYQTALTPRDGVRDVPDVSLLADDVNDGMWVAIGNPPRLQAGWGGTSEAAPQWAGFLAIVAQHKGSSPLIDPHVRLYQLAASAQYKNTFHDVTQGNNAAPGFAGFTAGRGFDLATGLGSYIGAALLAAY
jgi:subtilase family serine protease